MINLNEQITRNKPNVEPQKKVQILPDRNQGRKPIPENPRVIKPNQQQLNG